MALHLFHKLVGRHVDTDIDHLKTTPLKHGSHEVLADVMEVTLHGTYHHTAHSDGSVGGQQRAHKSQRRLHRPARHQQLGHEGLTVLKTAAQRAHRLDHLIIHQRLRRGALSDSRPCGFRRSVSVTTQDGLIESAALRCRLTGLL